MRKLAGGSVAIAQSACPPSQSAKHAVIPSLLMAKFKAAKGKKKDAPRPPAAISCVVLILVGMVLIMVFMYEVMKHANG